MGLGHGRTALVEYLIMLAAGASAFWAAQREPSVQLAVLAMWCGLYAFGMTAVDWLWKTRAST
jgi:hypothetical protein